MIICRDCKSGNVNVVESHTAIYGNELVNMNSYKCGDCNFSWTECKVINESVSNANDILLG